MSKGQPHVALFTKALLISICFHLILLVLTDECQPRDFDKGSVVCVCNTTHCDSVPEDPLPDEGALVYVSTKNGARMERILIVKKRSKTKPPFKYDAEILVNFSIQYQKIDGFGGSFTDAFGINVVSLPKGARKKLMESYFGSNGIKYNLGRVPIASSDFSLSNYSYDDVAGDFELKHFRLNEADIRYKIPLILRAYNLSKNSLKIFASPWAAPFWMKTNQMMQCDAKIIGQPGGIYYKIYANYIVKFLQEYEKKGIRVWRLSVINEPQLFGHTWRQFQATRFSAEMERDFIKWDLGPALELAGYGHVKLMIVDESRYLLPEWAQVIAGDPQAVKYVSHISLHWYDNQKYPIEALDQTHALFPNISLIGTEACAGYWQNTVELGNWERAEEYATDIIQTLNHWYTGWIDWNMALNLEGGPNWIDNHVDSPIIVNSTSGEFYKQPMFYALGHFSAFLPRDSIRVHHTINGNATNILVTTFLNSEGSKVAVVMNKNDFQVNLRVRDLNLNAAFNYRSRARSIATLLWK